MGSVIGAISMGILFKGENEDLNIQRDVQIQSNTGKRVKYAIGNLTKIMCAERNIQPDEQLCVENDSRLPLEILTKKSVNWKTKAMSVHRTKPCFKVSLPLIRSCDMTRRRSPEREWERNRTEQKNRAKEMAREAMKTNSANAYPNITGC